MPCHLARLLAEPNNNNVCLLFLITVWNPTINYLIQIMNNVNDAYHFGRRGPTQSFPAAIATVVNIYKLEFCNTMLIRFFRLLVEPIQKEEKKKQKKKRVS
jgi:hypothetical protein